MKFLILSTLTLLALAPAKAVVLIQTINVSVSAGPRDPDLYDFDMNGDGRIDWSLRSRESVSSAGVNAIASLNTFFVYQSDINLGFGMPTPMMAGNIIGQIPEIHYYWGIGTSPSLLSVGNHGNFGGFLLREGYLGLQFQSDEGIHYGYAYLKNSAPAVITVTELAWETEPGKAIRAGNIPEPTTSLSLLLALLAATQIRRR